MSLNKTSIEWTDFTWNPVTGCFNSCQYCYARKMANHWLRKTYLKNKCVAEVRRKGDPNEDPFWARFWKDRLNDPEKVSKKYQSKNPYMPPGSGMIFTVDMGDLFGRWIPDSWISTVLQTCSTYPQHVFQILTKFPENASKYNFPENIWLGTTVTTMDELIRVNSLIRSSAKVKFISFEPLHDDIFPKREFNFPKLRFIDWKIIGAETGQGRKKNFPKIEWVNNIIAAARTYHIPVFIKENLLNFNGNPTGLPRIQEFPTCGYCAHWKEKCSWLISSKRKGNTCDWIPSRFYSQVGADQR